MSVAILDSLRAEEARLVEQMAALPLFRQLEAIRQSIASLAAVYAATPAVPAANDEAEKLGTRNASVIQMVTKSVPRPIKRSRESSMTSRVVSVATELFRETGKRYQSGPIIDVLVQRGVIPARTKPLQGQISSILSHCDQFENTHDGRGLGYGLREWATVNGDDASIQPRLVS